MADGAADERRAAARPLTRLLAAWLLFAAGQWTFTVAAGVFAYGMAGATGAGAVTVARVLPAVLGAPLAGVLADRVDRTRVAALSCAIQALAIGAAALAAADDSLGGLVIALTAASATGSAPRPALQSLLPAFARTPVELTRATAVWGAADSVGFLTGAGLGGLALAVTGEPTMLGVAAAVIALSGAVMAGLPATAATAPDGDDALGGVLGGLRAIRETRLLHTPYALFVGLLLLEGTSDVQLVALALDDLDLGAGGPGLLYAVWGAGGLVGSWVLLVLVRRAGFGRALLVAALGFGVALALCGVGTTAVVVLALVPVGVAYSVLESAVMGIVPRLTDDAVVGRVYAVSEFLHAAVTAAGAALAPLLIHAVGITHSLVLVGTVFAVFSLLAVRACGRLDAGEQRAGRVRDLLHGVPFLAALPLPRLERLVRDARPVSVTAGEVIVRAGEAGEEFFVIEHGAVDIVEYGRRQLAGEGFGEIALLRDVPRTATVRAATDATLWAVSRPAFRAAVGAHGEVSTAAEAVMAEHLARRRRPRPR